MAALDRPVAKPRPIFLNLFAIRQPLPAIVSILHRVSGALLFLIGIPALLWGVQASLASPEAFAQFKSTMAHPLAKLVTLVLVWAYLHHLLAGLRHLLLDVHTGIDLGAARRSSAVVLVLALVLTAAAAVRLVSPTIRHTAIAHYGWRDWLSQRVTAVVMALYTLLVLGIVLWHGGIDHAVWRSVFAHAGFKLATFVFMVALIYHAWVGVRNIAMDYIKHGATRLLVQVVVICLLIAYSGWTIQVLWG